MIDSAANLKHEASKPYHPLYKWQGTPQHVLCARPCGPQAFIMQKYATALGELLLTITNNARDTLVWLCRPGWNRCGVGWVLVMRFFVLFGP